MCNQLIVLKKVQEIQKRLQELATAETKSFIQKFVPGSQKVYGVKMPFLNALSKKCKEFGFELVYALWESGSFEERMLAAKLIGLLCKKFPHEALGAVEKFSSEIQDWAICDTLGTQSLKPIAHAHEEEIFTLAKRLNGSENFWQRRLSLVLVEVFTKQQKLHPAINRLIRPLEKDKEYYVKKSVEWLKRDMAKHSK